MNFETPQLDPLITKEFLLSKHSEETYMSTYLRLPIQKGLQISPLRKDKRPTCSFCRSKNGELMFHDFGTGFHANFIGVVMEIHKCTYRQALRIIAEDFGLVKKLSERPTIKIKTSDVTLVEKSETIIQVQPRPFTNSELKWWNNFGITPKTLKRYKVCACESVFLNGNYFSSSTPHIPIYGYYCGKKQEQELWRLYFPSKRTFRFLSNVSKSYIQGSRQLPRTGDLLLITKSLKDVMLAYELGIPAIAPCSEVLFISKRQYKALRQRFKTIVVLYDTDLTGIKNLKQIKKTYPDIKTFFIPRKYKVKDMSDFYKAYGDKETRKRAQETINYFKGQGTNRQTQS